MARSSGHIRTNSRIIRSVDPIIETTTAVVAVAKGSGNSMAAISSGRRGDIVPTIDS